MKLLLTHKDKVTQEIDVEDMITPDKIDDLISQLPGQAPIIVLSLSYNELDTLTKIIINIGARAKFTLPALAKTDFYLNILEGFGVNPASLSFIDNFTDAIVPNGRDIIPSIPVPATPRHIFIAIENGNFNLVEQFLTDHPDLLTILTETHETLLHCAVKSKNKEIMEYLLSLGVDPTRCDEKGMLPANIAVKNKMPGEIVLPLLKGNPILYRFFYASYDPKKIRFLHSKTIFSPLSNLSDLEQIEIINFLIKSEIFPSMEEKHIFLREEQLRIRFFLPFAIEQREWLIATAYLGYIKPHEYFYIRPPQLDLIVKSENIDLVVKSLPYTGNTLSGYQLPSVTLTDNNTQYFTQLIILLLMSGCRLDYIKEFSDKHQTLRDEINKPLPILFSNVRKFAHKLFHNIIKFNHKVFSLNDLEELLQTLEENTDITQIQLCYCELDGKSAGTLSKTTPEAADLIKKILLKLYLNNLSLANLGSSFLQWHNKFTQMENLNQHKFLNKLQEFFNKLQSVLEPVKNILEGHPEYLFNILVNCNKLIACIKQVTGLNYVLTCTDLSSLALENLESVYVNFFKIADETLLSQNPLSKILGDRLQAIANKLKLELEKRGVAIPNLFDIAISLIKIDDSQTLQRYIHQGEISIRDRDKDNNTLLHHAVMALALDSIRMLSALRDCELDAINNQSETPFLLAIKSNEEDHKIKRILVHLYEALRQSEIDPHAPIPSTPLPIQNSTVAEFLFSKGISIVGHDMQNRILYNFDLHQNDGSKSSLDELLRRIVKLQTYSDAFVHFLNLAGINFDLGGLEELVNILRDTRFIRINLSKSRLVKITEFQSNEILDNIIGCLFANQCKERAAQNLAFDQVIISIISIIKILKNEIDKPDISSLSLFNNTQDQILELLHLFKTFDDILETQNMALFTEPVIRILQELPSLLASTPSLQNFPVFPILQISCSDLNIKIIELLSSLDLLESTLTDLPEEQTSTLETTTLSEKTFIGNSSSPSDTALSSSSIPLTKNIPEDIHAIQEQNYAISLLADLKKIKMDSLPEMEMENYINADREEVENAIVGLQNQLSKILDKLDGLIKKSELIEIGGALEKKVDHYCNSMMGENAYNKPYKLYCEIRSLAEQFNREWEKILSPKISGIPYSQNRAALLPPQASPPSANSSSSPKACAQLSLPR